VSVCVRSIISAPPLRNAVSHTTAERNGTAVVASVLRWCDSRHFAVVARLWLNALCMYIYITVLWLLSFGYVLETNISIYLKRLLRNWNIKNNFLFTSDQISSVFVKLLMQINSGRGPEATDYCWLLVPGIHSLSTGQIFETTQRCKHKIHLQSQYNFCAHTSPGGEGVAWLGESAVVSLVY
jgi:hypothetical protein